MELNRSHRLKVLTSFIKGCERYHQRFKTCVEPHERSKLCYQPALTWQKEQYETSNELETCILPLCKLNVSKFTIIEWKYQKNFFGLQLKVHVKRTLILTLFAVFFLELDFDYIAIKALHYCSLLSWLLESIYT